MFQALAFAKSVDGDWPAQRPVNPVAHGLRPGQPRARRQTHRRPGPVRSYPINFASVTEPKSRPSVRSVRAPTASLVRVIPSFCPPGPRTGLSAKRTVRLRRGASVRERSAAKSSGAGGPGGSSPVLASARALAVCTPSRLTRSDRIPGPGSDSECARPAPACSPPPRDRGGGRRLHACRVRRPSPSGSSSSARLAVGARAASSAARIASARPERPQRGEARSARRIRTPSAARAPAGRGHRHTIISVARVVAIAAASMIVGGCCQC